MSKQIGLQVRNKINYQVLYLHKIRLSTISFKVIHQISSNLHNKIINCHDQARDAVAGILWSKHNM